MVSRLGYLGEILKDFASSVRRFIRRLAFYFDEKFAGSSSDAMHRAVEARSPPRTLFIDMTVISYDDAGTGIQRVVRALALALLKQPLEGWRIQFVGATRKRAYRHISWPAREDGDYQTFMEARAGDVFLGLDYSLDAVRCHWRQLAAFRRGGGTLWFLVHDLLPVQRPEWFSRPTVRRYKAWLDILDRFADGFLCNSAQTEVDLLAELQGRKWASSAHRTAILPMGHDILEAVHEGAPARTDLNTVRPSIGDGRSVLSVGTIEPRKGHADLLNAFDVLWEEGLEYRLILVGRLGWHVEDLHRRIVSHPEFGRKLIWLNDADDSALIETYRLCDGVIIASHGEGFGLPLIEALGHGKPVLARDLPIFHPHEASGVRFFPKDAEPSVFADRIREWLIQLEAGEIVVVPSTTSWTDSARAMMKAIGMEDARWVTS